MKKIAVFASGNGSNLQALIDAIKMGMVQAEIAIVVSDQPKAYCLTRAMEANIATFAFRAKDYNSKEDYEKVIKERLLSLDVQYLVLAGYMRLIGPVLLECYGNKIINIHPSLLPDFPGKDGIGQALAAGVKETGVTVHFVDEGMDTGPIIAQEIIALDEYETRSSLEKKIHAVEHRLYPRVLQEILESGEK